MKFVNSMLDLVGNTPVLKLNKIAKDVPANVFVKLEYLNPSGSYKDRIALAMVEAAEKGLTWNNKKLNPGDMVVDASSGNTAPALAFVCAVKGYKVKILIYKHRLDKFLIRSKITEAYGAKTDEPISPYDFIKENDKKFVEEHYSIASVIAAKMQLYQLEQNDPNVIWVDQVYNKYNYISQMAIGYELYKQLDGKIDAFGTAVGAGATLLGVSLAFAEKKLFPLTFGILPLDSDQDINANNSKSEEKDIFKKFTIRKELIEKIGLKKWQTEKYIFDIMLGKGYPDEFFSISNEEARNMANRLCREEGIYCGMSSGANVAVALKIAQRLKKNQNVVTIIVDRRDRYLGEYPNDIFVV